MPSIQVTLAVGRTSDQLRDLIHRLTIAMHEAIGAPIDSVQVIVHEVPTTHFAKGDMTLAERPTILSLPRATTQRRP